MSVVLFFSEEALQFNKHYCCIPSIMEGTGPPSHIDMASILLLLCKQHSFVLWKEFNAGCENKSDLPFFLGGHKFHVQCCFYWE